MLPVYVSYFAGGGADGENKTKHTVLYNALGFVLGFTIVFVLMGAAAGTIGSFIKEHTLLFNLAGGLILVLMGLNYAGIIKINVINRTGRPNLKIKPFNFISAILFGVIFSIGWTPCVGAFLGSALMLAANSSETFKGIIMLLLFSLGLGIPFIISALLLDSLKTAFSFIKKHYRVINLVCGFLLIAVGLLMMSGRLNVLLALLTLR